MRPAGCHGCGVVPDADLTDGTPVYAASSVAHLLGVPLHLVPRLEDSGRVPRHVAERFGVRFYDAFAVDRVTLADPDRRETSGHVILTHSQGGSPALAGSGDYAGGNPCPGPGASPVDRRSGPSLPFGEARDAVACPSTAGGPLP